MGYSERYKAVESAIDLWEENEALEKETERLKKALYEALGELNFSDNDYFYQLHHGMEKYQDIYSSVLKELERGKLDAENNMSKM